MDYRCILRRVHFRNIEENEENSHPISFSLKSAKDLDCVDVGMPLFERVTRDPEIIGFNPAIKGFVPKEEDQIQLTVKQQSWLLVEIPTLSDYENYAWAALRPARTILWERHAQERSDGFYSPPGFIPRYPEPGKWYKRRTGSDYMSCSQHPCNCQKLRFLVRLSDALSQAAVDCTQDWFFLDLPIFASAPTETVGDLLLFAAGLVGNNRLRAGYLALSGGLPNSRLWQCKTPLLVVWNHLHIASLKLTGEVTAFTSLNSADHTSQLGMNEDAMKEEGEYFAMASISSLPKWVISDERKELRMNRATGPCRLPHEELKAIQSEEQQNVTARTSGKSHKNKKRSPNSGSAASAASTPSTDGAQSRLVKRVSFQ